MNGVIISLIMLIILLLIPLGYLLYEKMKSPNWSSEPKQSYNELSKLFGKPDTLNKNKKGVAIWDNLGDFPAKNLTIVDEAVPHCCPNPHKDTILAELSVEIPDIKYLASILDLSKGVSYDQQKGVLSVRGGSLPEIVATYVLATRILKSDTRPDNVPQMYKDLLSTIIDKNGNPISTNDKIYKDLLDELKGNLSKAPVSEIKSCKDDPAPCSNVFTMPETVENYTAPYSMGSPSVLDLSMIPTLEDVKKTCGGIDFFGADQCRGDECRRCSQPINLPNVDNTYSIYVNQDLPPYTPETSGAG